MTKSEQITSAISEKYFFKDFICDNLLFRPMHNTEKELCDLILNFGDSIIVFQIKERNENEKTKDVEKEMQWLEKVTKKARNQMKDTLRCIKTNELAFKNKQGEILKIEPTATVIPVIIFDNNEIGKYPKTYKSREQNGLDINYISLPDFNRICEMNITPCELVGYLQTRLDLFINSPMAETCLIENETYNFQTTSEEAIFQFYIQQAYGQSALDLKKEYQETFKFIVANLWERTITDTSYADTQTLLKFLIKLNRIEIIAFIERIIFTMDEAKKQKCKLTGNLHMPSNYVIFFIACTPDTLIDSFEEWYALKQARENTTVKCIVIVYIFWEDDEHFRMDFKYYLNDINEKEQNND